MNALAAVWKRLTRHQQLAAAVLGGAAILVGADALLLRPLRTRLAALHRQVREAEMQLVDAMVASAQAEAVNRAFERYQPYVQASGSAESELGAVYAEVQSAVRDLGMPLLNLKQGAVEADGEPTVSVSLECEASPTQLVQLLDRLQRSTRLLKVTSLNIRTAEGRTLRVSLVISKLLLEPTT